MTRINLGVNPNELTDKHLIAEHREIIRIPNAIKKGKAKLENIPVEFKLGTGHVKFFYDKLLHLKKRYEGLYLEGKKRGFNLTDFREVFNDLPPELLNDYTPSKHDRQLILDRIAERLASSNSK